MRATLKTIVETVGASVVPTFAGRDDALVLAYHNVVPTAQQVGEKSLHLHVDRFESQLNIIRKRLDVVSLEELLESPSSGAPRIAVTFDDAYAGAITTAVPLCISLGIPCTVFIAPKLLGTHTVWDRRASQSLWSEDDRDSFLWSHQGHTPFPGDSLDPSTASLLPLIATLDEIRKVSQEPLVHFGNHTMNHVNLGALTTEECVTELSSAQQWLRESFGANTVPYIAYPYGIPAEDPDEVLRMSGLTRGLLVSGGWFNSVATKATRVPRWNIPAALSNRGFDLRLRGRFPF